MQRKLRAVVWRDVGAQLGGPAIVAALIERGRPVARLSSLSE